MVQVVIDWDEWYPVYSYRKATPEDRFSVEVDQSDLDLINRWEEDFGESQEMLHEMHIKIKKKISEHEVKRSEEIYARRLADSKAVQELTDESL